MLRRQFLQTVGLLPLLPSLSWACDTPSFNSLGVAILSDLHVSPDNRQRLEVQKWIQAILNLSPLPKRLLIFGDFALETGKKEEYETIRELLAPIENAGIVWDAVFGNHDNRENFFSVFPEKEPASFIVPDKWTSIVQTPVVDFILLDSHIEGKVGGEMDEPQKEWLDATMAAAKKPFFVGAHHPINETGLAELLKKYPLCAGYLHGHRHVWETNNFDSVPTLCFPSAGGWGEIGYSTLKLSSKSADFDVTLSDYYPPRYNPDDPREPEWVANIKEKNNSKVSIPVPAI